MTDIPVERTQSRAEAFIQKMGWTARPSGSGDNHAIETCPFCQGTGWKFFIAIGGEKDGLYKCHRCGEEGNYYQLREKLGVAMDGAISMQDVASSRTPPEDLANVEKWAKALHEERSADILDYLVHGRKFSMEVIEKYKLGAARLGDDLAYVIPYFDAAGKPVFYKMRTIPPAKKKFKGASGRENPLFNENILKPGMEELIMVEGEADALAILSAGYETVVGVPGAGQKKATWIEKLDHLAPKTIYLLYDNDKVGQDAAREMATRIGLDKVKNILLPEFTVLQSDGTEKPGKDINEWLVAGHPIESLEQLKAEARVFDVEGVQNLADVLEDLRTSLVERGTDPMYLTPWPSLTKRVGGFEPGDVCGVLASPKVGKTSMALNWVDWYAVNGVSSMLFCGEMPAVRLVRKWISYKLQLDDSPGRSELKPEHITQGVDLAAEYKADLLFGYSRTNREKEVFETIRQAVRRYGVKVVCYDNLHLMSRSLEHQTQEISKLMKEFKAMAMELNIFIILILQPRKVQDGQIVSANDALGSQAIQADVDCMICLHRNRVGKITVSEFNGFMDTEENFEPHLLLRADLTRYAPGGTCTLWMDGARSTVRELVATDTTDIPKPSGAIEAEPIAV